MEDHVELALPLLLGQTGVLAQPLKHVLNVNNGIVDKRADGYGHAADAHGVDGEPHDVEHKHGDEQRERDGDKRDDGCAGVHEEDEEHEHHEDASLDKRLLDVGDGRVDKVLLTIELRVHLHVLGQRRPHLLHHLIELPGELKRARRRLLGDGQQDGRLARDRSQAHLRTLHAHLDVGNIGKHHRLSLGCGCHDRLSEKLGVGGGEHAAHNILVAALIEHATRGVAVHVARGIHDLCERHTIMAHALRMNAYLIFHDVAAHDRDLSHATRGEELRTNGPVGERAQVAHGGAVSCEAYEHDLAEDARLRSERGLPHPLWQGIADGCQLLRHDLSVAVDVGTPVELYPHHRKACC